MGTEGGIFLSQVVSPGHMAIQVKLNGLSRIYMFMYTHSLREVSMNLEGGMRGTGGKREGRCSSHI